jgi:hypothetical protein
MNTHDDIEYCKFCIDKPMILGRVVEIKYSCRHCPNNYKRWDNGGNGWMFIHEKYTVDVYSNFSQVFFTKRSAHHESGDFVCEFRFQLLPDTTDADIDLYITFL